MPSITTRLQITALLTMCSLLSACNGDHTPPQTDTGGPATRSTSSVSDLPAIIHMTGLVLIVPPKQSGGPTNIVLPLNPATPNHVALLGIGVETAQTDTARLCTNKPTADLGICYVDLDKWSLDPIGTGGTTLTINDLNQIDVVNVTRGSGGPHKVDFSKLDGLVRSQLVFSGGKLGTPCALGRWTFQPPGQAKDPLEAPNVVRWEMRLTAGSHLVFRLKSNPNVTIQAPPIPNPNTGIVEIVLAHIPATERGDLPPTPASPPTVKPGPEEEALHFEHYYGVLARQGVSPGQGMARTKPKFAVAPTPPPTCAVAVSTPVLKILEIRTGVRTYACMPASGELGP